MSDFGPGPNSDKKGLITPNYIKPSGNLSRQLLEIGQIRSTLPLTDSQKCDIIGYRLERIFTAQEFII